MCHFCGKEFDLNFDMFSSQLLFVCSGSSFMPLHVRITFLTCPIFISHFLFNFVSPFSLLNCFHVT